MTHRDEQSMRRRIKSTGRAQVRPGGLRAQPLRVISGGDQEQGGGVGADTVQGEQARSASGDERGDELIQARELGVEELGAKAQLAQRDRGWHSRRDRRAGAAATPGSLTRAAAACPANRARRSSAPVTISDLAWLIVWVCSARALRLATISARIASTAPSRPFGAPPARPDWAARAALTRVQRVGFALAQAVLAVGAVHLDDPARRPR